MPNEEPAIVDSVMTLPQYLQGQGNESSFKSLTATTLLSLMNPSQWTVAEVHPNPAYSGPFSIVNLGGYTNEVDRIIALNTSEEIPEDVVLDSVITELAQAATTKPSLFWKNQISQDEWVVRSMAQELRAHLWLAVYKQEQQAVYGQPQQLELRLAYPDGNGELVISINAINEALGPNETLSVSGDLPLIASMDKNQLKARIDKVADFYAGTAANSHDGAWKHKFESEYKEGYVDRFNHAHDVFYPKTKSFLDIQSPGSTHDFLTVANERYQSNLQQGLSTAAARTDAVTLVQIQNTIQAIFNSFDQAAFLTVKAVLLDEEQPEFETYTLAGGKRDVQSRFVNVAYVADTFGDAIQNTSFDSAEFSIASTVSSAISGGDNPYSLITDSTAQAILDGLAQPFSGIVNAAGWFFTLGKTIANALFTDQSIADPLMSEVADTILAITDTLQNVSPGVSQSLFFDNGSTLFNSIIPYAITKTFDQSERNLVESVLTGISTPNPTFSVVSGAIARELIQTLLDLSLDMFSINAATGETVLVNGSTTTLTGFDSEQISQIVPIWSNSSAIPQNSQLLANSTTYFNYNAAQHAADVIQTTVQTILDNNPFLQSQINSASNYSWLNQGQTIQTSVSAVILGQNPNMTQALVDNLAPQINQIAGSIQTIAGNISYFVPSVSINLFSSTLNFGLSVLSGINSFLNSLTPIGAFYEGGELTYDESVSIADKTARLFDGTTPVTAAQFDALDTNSDGVINGSDTGFANLKVWQDMNENGIVDSGEMKTLPEAGISTIPLSQKEIYTSSSGNSVVSQDVDALRSSLAISAPTDSAPTAASDPTPADSAPTNSAPTIDYNYYRNTLDPVHTASGHVWQSNEIKLTNDSQYLVGTTAGDVFGSNWYASSGYTNVPNLLGGSGNDLLFGYTYDQYGSPTTDGGINNNIWGGAGDDWMASGAGNDQIMGESGNDLAYGQLGNDTMWGGDGNDTLVGFYQGTDSTKTLGSGQSDNDLILGGAGNDVIIGQVGNDTLSGEDGDDIIGGFRESNDSNTTLNQYETDNDKLFGGAGNDTLIGQVGNDSLQGGADSDLLVGFYLLNDQKQSLSGSETDNDTLLGGTGNDSLIGGIGNDVLSGDDGNDIVYGFTFSDDTKSALAGNETDDDQLFGGAGSDTLVGGVGNDTLSGGADGDLLVGFAQTSDYKTTLSGSETDDDVLIGGGGNDSMLGDVGNDQLAGDDGDDLAFGQLGNDSMWGGAGNDTLSGFYQLIDSVQTVGSGQSDNDLIFGGSGNDSIWGQAGNDTLSGDDGNDQISGFTSSDDTKTTLGTYETDDDELFGGAGNDTLFGGIGNDTMDGGTGNDLLIGFYGIDGSNNPDPAHELNGATDADVMFGGDGNDTLFGQVGNDSLFGDDGDDLILGFTSGNDPKQTLAEGETDNDLLSGGAGNDQLIGQTGDDELYGGDGNDTIWGYDVPVSENYNLPEGETDNDTLFGGAGNDELQGQVGNDFLLGETGEDRLFGGVGDDTMYGGEGNDIMLGFTGSNEIKQTLESGETDNDFMYGSAGADTLLGGLGNDYLDGGAGADSMEGGAGDDTYVINTINDVILERQNAGTDTVLSNVTYLLNSEVENLRLLGSDDIHGSGNKLDNAIYGNAGNNILDGITGADTMIGYAGNDVYYVDDANDVVVEQANEGTDSVQSSISWTLGDNVEDLTLLSYNTPEKGRIDGQDVLIYGYPKRYELDYAQGDKNPEYLGSCAIATISNLITLAGGTVTEEQVLEYAVQNNLAVTSDESLDPLLRGGTTMAEQIQLMSHFGYSTGNHIGLDFELMAEKVKSGHGVLLAVDGHVLWDQPNTGDINHVVTVSGVVYNSDNTEIIGFYICDSGRRLVSDMTRYVSYADLEAAADLPSAYFIFTSDPLKLWDVDIDATGNSLDNKLVGTDGNNILDGMSGADSLVGGKGNDTYIVDNADDLVFEDVNSGTDTVETSLTHTLVANVENLVLTGTADVDGFGNAANNVITGNSGNNLLDGSTGVDTLIGGAGNDSYIVDNSDDVITESVDGGTDEVTASVSYGLSGNVENLTLTGDSNINATGNDLANALTGNSGDNVLDGGVGEDVLVGGAGNDTYIVDDADDVVTEASNEGTDTIQTNLSYSIASLGNVENLTLTGSANIDGTGNDLNNVLIGNSGVNSLSGGIGADTLDGGAGADALVGGVGNDTYVVDNAGDAITEASAEGTDVVQSSVSYTLADNVENLILTGASGLTGTGNELDNVIAGNSAGNSLVGADGADTLIGGGGVDTLVGGSGNDVYLVDGIDDVVTEGSAEGTDTVEAGITYSLSSIANVENLTLTGTGAIDGTGNSLDNIIAGNIAANILDGGTGTDTLVGGAGNDTYLVDDVNDVVTEGSSEGTDTIQTGITYSIASIANVEKLTLTGTGAVNATGNSLDNLLTGNSGDNSLSGGDGSDTLVGGGGTDTLIGGVGNDVFVVDDLNDVVTEGSSEGTDTVQTDITYSLASLANVENLTLTGSNAVDATGNDLDNVLTGNTEDNTLTGGLGGDTLIGGGGTDTLIGGVGNDVYHVNDLDDVVTEGSGEGTDTITTDISYSLGSIANVENLTLTGTDAVDATGNDLDNVITGNSGANMLNGGTGTDTLIGAAGNDIYVVDDINDVVTESADAGTDTIQTDITYSLASIANVENLTLTGSNAVNATGNDLNNILTGNTADNSLSGGAGADTLVGGGGNDTLIGGTGNDVYVVDAAADVVTEASGEGTDTIQAGISYSLASIANVENLTLTGTDEITATGNDLNNVLVGNISANTLDGGVGADSLVGGAGNDTYIVDDAGDVVTETAGGGTDAVEAGVTYALTANVENLILTGSGNINATGNTLNNVITGNNGNNLIDGLSGADTLAGGAGNDTYVVDNANDVITEESANGTDLVQSSVSHTLSDNVENLTLTGSLSIDATGNALDNALIGNTGNNVLDGGAGNDSLTGGTGDDTYVVDSLNDVVTENASEGKDTIETGITYTLASLGNIENLTLTGSADVNATGNDADNVLLGNSGANSIVGGLGADTIEGGTGADTLVGGLGNDVYIVDADDVVTESSAEGTDTVQSSATYSIASVSNVENLTLTGTNAINATGNSLDNVLTGNSAANILDGGTGTDSLVGGAGNDTYVVDDLNDVVTENTNEGTDTIQTGITYSLESIANVEGLTLTGVNAVDATGNELKNILTGNSAANILDGGLGADTMIGGGGNDTYIVDNDGDAITENSAEGTDLVKASVTHTLSANVENLTLTGTGNSNGTGNNLNNVLTGNIGSNILNGGTGTDTLIGGLGNDVYVIDDYNDVVTENANEGTDTIQTGITYSLASLGNIENVTLSGVANVNATGNSQNNTLLGNVGNNSLVGADGNDTLSGAAGVDTMVGGAGDDTYVVDNQSDVVVEATDAGTDKVHASVSYTLSDDVEDLFLTGVAGISGTGNDLNNTIQGNTAGNTLDGGTGTDFLIGGLGNDLYIVDDLNDVVTESADEGVDTIQTDITYSLDGIANVENLTLTGSSSIDGTGNDLDNVLTGSTGANSLVGGSGNDTLDGGAAADTLVGGTGSDTYFVDNVDDVVTEFSSEGADTVQASVSYALSDNVETLFLSGSGNINATGNALDNLITGNSGDNVLDGGSGSDTLQGGAGNDTYVVDSLSDVVTEGSSQGTDTIQTAITYSLSSVNNVENLELTGTGAVDGTGNSLNNVITGNIADNSLSGAAGADTLIGGGGADTLIGGIGDDVYQVDDLTDVVTESGGEGTDRIETDITYSLASIGNVENLTLTGSADIDATGNSLANSIVGNSGSNILNGGSGADTMTGGLGDDTYIVDNAADVVVEDSAQGTDAVEAGVSHTLANNVENLTLTGSGNISGTGNALDNVITGNSGNNQLDGGLGADTLIGGAGDDTYLVDDMNDVVSESAAEGTDTIVSSLTYALGSDLENLTLSGTSDIDGTGNELANSILGNAGDNVLDGGAGIDTLTGAAGNDTYLVDNVDDTVVESTSEGTDVVEASVSYTLSANVENLMLSGSGNTDGIGNALDNMLTGNSGNNILDGAAGADTLIGGVGDDTYVVDSLSDVVVENEDEGLDEIQAAISYSLASLDDVENLTLIGTSNTDATGNSQDNVVTGNTGNNVLDGGSGDDTLIGGAGNDLYVVDSSQDVVTELSSEGVDTIQTSLTYSLASLANVENLTLTGASEVSGTGNDLDNVLIGNEAANTLDGGIGADTLIGGLGNDTLIGGVGDDLYVIDSQDDVITENADEGNDGVETGISYSLAPLSNVENLALTGTANVDATGNDADNVLTGNSGNNVIDGGIGADTLIGGAGDDTFIVDSVNDVIIENSSEEIDVVQASVDYTLADNIENLILTGTQQIDGTGNSLNNVITGNSNTNYFNGGGGIDTLIGGDGSDHYTVDDLDDVVVEEAGEGSSDTIYTGITYSLANISNVERLTLTGTASVNGTGNELNNYLTGNSGNNVLDGGSGNDTMSGGSGNDTYVVDSTGDSIVDSSGTDTVMSSISYTLQSGLEHLTLTGSVDTNGTGNSSANILTGNAGNNSLSGSSGADTMIGGAGNDTYTVDNAGDVITELSDEGNDSVSSSVTYTLSANIENLTLTGAGSTHATGNSSDNYLTGNTGNNSLTGGDGNDTLDGGTGNDTMLGGVGDDLYYVNATGDAVSESSGQGTDTVNSSITYTLGSNVENLTLSGSGNINGTGNTLDNILIGNSGHNNLNGGTGNDTMVGGLGNDTYTIDSLDDVVVEYENEGIDKIQTAFTHTLSDVFENLTLTGSSAIDGTGNSLDNYITGNTGANSLVGAAGNDTLDGGSGNDTMVGGVGDDIYYVNAGGDVVTEYADEGIDTVNSSVTYTLASTLENLTLTGGSVIDGTGNSLDNYLIGNSAANSLTGAEGNDSIDGGNGNDTITGGEGNDTIDGGSGNDTMVGGMGDDTYYVNATNDVVTESASEGTETVYSTATYTIGANIENLTLTGASSVNATGNSQANVITGNTGHNVLSGGAGVDTLVGGLGNDTYVMDDLDDVIVEQSGQGSDTVQIGITYTLTDDNLENVTLTGSSAIDATGNNQDNYLTGNSGANSLTGGIGNDTMDGGAGIDTMVGGVGDDVYFVDSASDVVTENADEGTDTVNSSITYTLASGLENITLTGSSGIGATGNSADNVLTGNSGANSLFGGAGNDTLNGGSGSDSMWGSTGDDVYYVDATGDIVIESSGQGVDLVYSTVSETLDINVENLTLLGSSNINATGNTLDNILTGNSGNNSLSGGTGADTMIGGAGNDTYVVDNVNDVVTENTDEGTDLIQSSVTYSLSSLGAIENLTLTGSSSIDATGNDLNNNLTGNTGNNVLTGGLGNDSLDGGSGADTLIGGAGNDTYTVDNVSDVINESSGEGVDTVNASITFTLLDNLERLTLTGSGNINGTGNDLDNKLTGNTGNNVLTGGLGNDTLDGGTGADTLVGGVGDDSYTVDNVSDVITESPNEGVDVVSSSVTYTLSANVENLTLTGSSAINGTGNAIDNYLTGNTGNNSLTGGDGNDTLNGGSGTDTLVGGNGDDTYIFDGSTDTITESAGGGTDTVISDVTYTLGANVENLSVHFNGLNSTVNGTGNSLDNYLTGDYYTTNVLSGGAGNDTLDGGGSGDTLVGGTGNDTYILDHYGISNVITEQANEGIDTVLVNDYASYVLPNNVENGFGGGGMTGNTLNNYLISSGSISGAAGNDTLLGSSGGDTLNGGTGNDSLTGGAGNDSYSFALGDGSDVVSDASGTMDKILFQSSIQQNDVAFYMNGDNLEIGYLGASDLITVEDQNISGNEINRLELNSGNYLSSSDVNSVIQQMAAYASANSISFTSLSDVKASTELMNIIATSWNSA